MIPYLQQLLKGNWASVIEWETNENDALLQVLVILGFMDGILKLVGPVISLDATHMKSEDHVGTLYIASALSAANEVYPLGFLLSSGNEDREIWTVFLRKLKEDCPCLCRVDKKTGMFPFVFILDSNKGLQPALGDVFLNNTNLLCVKHIESNIKERLGAQCAKYVFGISKHSPSESRSFSLIKSRS